MIFVWIALAVVSGVVEGATVALVSIWFVAGSIGGLVSCALGAPIWLQFLIAIVLSIGCFAGFRPMLMKSVSKEAKAIDDYTGKLVSKTAIVTADIRPAVEGQVKLDGAFWRAKAYDESLEIKEGQQVIVCKIEGNCCTVTPIENI